MRDPAARSVCIIYVLLALFTIAVFGRTLGNGFVNLDDNLYVYENPHVKLGLSFENLIWALKTTDQCFWHPLVWLTYFMDRHIWGIRPLGFHVTNLILHVANVLLLFHVMNFMTRAVWRSAFVSVLFAVHPLHVESVAWISERKDVLSTVFWLLTMWAYVLHAKLSFECKCWKTWAYPLVIVFFIIGLSAKPMLVTLPFVLLLLDYWPLKRVSGLEVISEGSKQTPSFGRKGIYALFLEKLPLFVLSIVFSGIAYYAQKAGNAISLAAYPASIRLQNAVWSYISYLGKTLWPRKLAVFYPHPGDSLQAWQVISAVILLISVSILVWLARRRRYLVVGWLWFLGTLVPVIGLVQVGSFAMADRYTYVPLIGLFVIAAWGFPDLLCFLCPESETNRLLMTLALIVSITFGVCAAVQTGYWKDSERLFTRALEVTANNALAHNNLGTALEEKGQKELAAEHYLRANRIQPNYARAYSNLGSLLAQQGRRTEAIRYLSHALRLDPGLWKAHYNLGVMFQETGDLRRAVAEYREVTRIKPDFPQAYANLGAALVVLGRFEEAISELRKALKLAPNLEEARFNLVVAFYGSGDYAATWQAVKECEKRGIRLPAAFISELERKMPRPR